MHIPLVTEIQRFSLQDGPGIRTTIYLKGCPLHCPWCHNPETISEKQEKYFHASRCLECGECARGCPSGSIKVVRTPDRQPIITTDRKKCRLCSKCVENCNGRAREDVGRRLDIEDIVREALADEIFYRSSGGGVTISGGEPLMFPDFLYELTRTLKEKSNVHIAIETSFFAKWKHIEKLLETIDLFIIDIKTMSFDKYKNVIGGSLDLVTANLDRLIKTNADIRIHLPIIPGFNNTDKDYDMYVHYLSQFADRLSGVDILPFHSYAVGKYNQLSVDYQYKDVKDLAPEEVLPLFNALKQTGIRQVTVGGIAGNRKPSPDSGK